MSNEKQILDAIQSLKDVSNNQKLINFLNSLDLDECRTYLYIEAQKSNVFVQELTSLKGTPLSIEDLKNEKLKKKVKSLLHNEIYIQNLIDFWDKFGQIDRPSLDLKRQMITKYEKFYQPLTENEKEFIINC